MDRKKNDRTIFWSCLIGSIIAVSLNISSVIQIAMIAGALFHGAMFFFIRDKPVSINMMQDLVEEADPYEASDMTVKRQLERFKSLRNTIEKNLLLTNRSMSDLSKLKDVLKDGEEAIISNARLCYSRYKIIGSRQYETRDDISYLNSIYAKNESILKMLEDLTGEIGENGRSFVNPVSIDEYAKKLNLMNKLTYRE